MSGRSHITANQKLFGEFLKELRGTRTQADIAARIGVTQPTYNRIERGYRQPHGGQIERLAQVFGVQPTRLSALIGRDSTELEARSEAVAELRRVFADNTIDDLTDPPGETMVVEFLRGWRRFLAVRRAVAGRRWSQAIQDVDRALEEVRTAAHGLEFYLLIAKGRSEMRAGRLYEAEATFGRLHTLAVTRMDRNALGHMHLGEGELAGRRGNWREALECLRRALTEFDSLDDIDYAEDLHAHVLRKMAIVYLQQGLWPDALPKLEGSWNHFESTEDLYEQAKVRMALGWHALYAGDIERSVAFREEALSLANQAGEGRELYLQMQANLYYALSLRERGGMRDREIALEKLAEAHRLALVQGLAQPPATIQLGVAQIHLDQLIWNDRTDTSWDQVLDELRGVTISVASNRIEEGYAWMLLGIAQIESSWARHRLTDDGFEAAIDLIDRAGRHFTRRDQRAYLAESFYLKSYYLLKQSLSQIHNELPGHDMFGEARAALKSARLAANLPVLEGAGYPMLAPRLLALEQTLDLLYALYVKRSGPKTDQALVAFDQPFEQARLCGTLTVQHVRRLQQLTVEQIRRG